MNLVCNEVVNAISSFAIFSPGKGALVVLTLVISLLPRGCLCSVSLPCVNVGWSVIVARLDKKASKYDQEGRIY